MVRRVYGATAPGTDSLTAGIYRAVNELFILPLFKARDLGLVNTFISLVHVCLWNKYELWGQILIALSTNAYAYAGPLKNE